MDLKSSKYVNNGSRRRVKDNTVSTISSNSTVSSGIEIVSLSSSHQYHHQNGNSSTSNKRKRRVISEVEDDEYKNPAKKSYQCNNNEPLSRTNSDNSSYPSPLEDIVDETQSSSSSTSECLSTVAEYNLVDTPSSSQQNDDEVFLNENGDDDDEEIEVIPTSSSQTSYDSSRDSHQEDDTSSNEFHATDANKFKCSASNQSDEEYLSSICVTPTQEIRLCPLPALSWANALDVWNLMCENDEIAAYDRSASMLKNHPGIEPRMRAILLDWIIEVSEVYKLHRETYYLAVDYIDRYLAATKNVQKNHLQLIGITCLFIAAKVEEIYPPKITEFAYVTDGACREEDILQHELLVLKTLDWDVSPVSIMAWLGVYMQLNVSNRTPECFSKNINPQVTANSATAIKSSSNIVNNSSNNKNYKKFICNNSNNTNTYSLNNSTISSKNSHNSETVCDVVTSSSTTEMIGVEKYSGNVTDVNDSGVSVSTPPANDASRNLDENDDAFIYPQFSGLEFVQTARLLDFCTYDVGIANYRYSVIAAAAMSHTFNREIALRVSGFDWDTIAPCAKWMEPFFTLLCEDSHHVHLMEKHDDVKTKYGLGHICPNIVTDDSHTIQTRNTSVELFDKLILKLELCNAAKNQEASPAITKICPEGLLTPPASDRKSPEI